MTFYAFHCVLSNSPHYIVIFLGNTVFVGKVENSKFYIKFENSNNLDCNTCMPA